MTETLAVQTARTPEDTLKRMRERLKGVVPDVELQLKADLVFEINRLKVERNAVILGHNYMEPALFHSVPDYTGDSLELSRQSAERMPTSSCSAASSSWPKPRRFSAPTRPYSSHR